MLSALLPPAGPGQEGIGQEELPALRQQRDGHPPGSREVVGGNPIVRQAGGKECLVIELEQDRVKNMNRSRSKQQEQEGRRPEI